MRHVLDQAMLQRVHAGFKQKARRLAGFALRKWFRGRGKGVSLHQTAPYPERLRQIRG